ncbi:MAG: hypothetical protein PHI97_01140 [Desulfobulbus sp.]|nr:hypothetical protein [Desulfobulbus sp.]
MELFGLVLYGSINIAMVIRYLFDDNRFYEFPFWAGVIALGWFFPQAIGGYFNSYYYPEGAYAFGMLFASLCTVALWIGFERAIHEPIKRNRLFTMQFNAKKLYYGGAFLIVAGFFFQWKLLNLPEEMLVQTQWTGAPVKYLFLSNIFKIGFLVLLIQYVRSRRWLSPRFLVFLIPCLLMLLSAAFLHGRRAEMMNLFAYIAVSLWFVRRITVPRGVLITLVITGIVLINGIGPYRSIMSNQGLSFKNRIFEVSNIDFLASSGILLEKSGREFSNYIMYRNFIGETNTYDFGLMHWNLLVFNYIPAQIVGSEVKSSLMIPIQDIIRIADERFGYDFHIGTVSTGYCDAFGSFGWFGFVKFLLIGWILGVLYKCAIHQSFLAQILYLYVLTTAMHAISHGTHQILLSVWVYFFLLGFPLLYWARARKRHSARLIGRQIVWKRQGGV